MRYAVSTPRYQQVSKLLAVTILICLQFCHSTAKAMPPSPDLVLKLKASGKLNALIERLKAARAKGIDRAAPAYYDSKVAPNEALSQRTAPDTFNVLVLLVDFSDNPASAGDLYGQPADFQNLLFSDDSADGQYSMTEFYDDNSYDRFHLNGTVIGWLRLPQTYAYYVNNDNGLGNYPHNAQRMVEDAITLADPLVDFSQFDNDGNGWCDGIFIVHAGPGAEQTGLTDMIWSHFGSTSYTMHLDGVDIQGYTTEPEELQGVGLITIGVFCHEYGHFLGLPDLYDPDYSSSGIGDWSLMSSGSWNYSGRYPAFLDAWCKKQLGFLTPNNISSGAPGLTIPASIHNPVAYRLWRRGITGNEYFLVENRQKVGHDIGIPGSGLLIFHVDEGVNDNTDENHPLLGVMQADGRLDLQEGLNLGDSTDVWSTFTQTEFSDSTVPNTRSYAGETTRTTIGNISSPGIGMTADFDIALPSISLDHVDGLYAPDTIPTGQLITFWIRLISDSMSHHGMTNGFRIHSHDWPDLDVACWGSTVADTLPLNWKQWFSLIFQISKFGPGCYSDTVGFGGSYLPGGSTGLPPGFDSVAYKITIGPIDSQYNGKTIILDSGFYRPTGRWKWTGPDAFPRWDGPHTYHIYDPNSGPTACGDLGARPNPDGWQFCNCLNNMWPQSWWGQFDYTSSQYPASWRFVCSPSDFPDWPLFVDAFGASQCYFDPPPGLIIYRPSAIAKWLGIKGAWGGSCFGFAVAADLFFDGYLSLASEFPGASNLYGVPINDESRKTINKYWIYQFGETQQQYSNEGYNYSTSSQTLADCQEMFQSSAPPRDDRVLVLYNNHGSGGHAVVPYRCEPDQSNSNIYYIYVYDNNYPNDFTCRIAINTSSNTWSYDRLSGWGGSQHLFLMGPVSDYESSPILSETDPSHGHLSNEKNGSASEHIEIYLPTTGTLALESPNGNIGLVGDSLFDDLADGMPIIPLTGQETPPIGYYLPNDRWIIHATDLSDTSFTLTLVTDSTVMKYTDSSMSLGGVVSLAYPGNDSMVTVSNQNSGESRYSMQIIDIHPDSEIVCEAQNISSAPGDSIRFSLSTGSEFKVDNFGPTTSYSLRVQITNNTIDTVFYHSGINIAATSSQSIVPDWRTHGDSIMILVDSDMSGEPDDTLNLPNEMEPGCCDVRGDVNRDGSVDISDLIYLVDYSFSGGSAPLCEEEGDVNGDKTIDVTDLIYLVDYSFSNGSAPVPCQ